MTPIWPRATRSAPAWSKALATPWSTIAWNRAACAGRPPALKPCCSSAPSRRTTTGKTSGPTAWLPSVGDYIPTPPKRPPEAPWVWDTLKWFDDMQSKQGKEQIYLGIFTPKGELLGDIQG